MFDINTIILLVIIFILIVLLISKSSHIKKLKSTSKDTYTLLNAINLPVFYKDKDGNFSGCNKSFDKSFGNFKKQAITELKQFRNSEIKEIDLVYDNEITKPTIINFTNYLDGSVGVLFDTSSMRSNKAKLLKQKESLELILKGSREGYWEWEVKTDKLTLSKRAKEILGYEEGEKAPEHIKNWLDLIESYDIAHTNEAIASHLSGKTPYIDVEHRLKTSLKEIWVNFRGKATYGLNNEPTKVHGTIRDISSQKIELTKITRQRDLFMTFMDNLPALSFIKDKDGKYIYLNDFYQKLLGFKVWENQKAEDLFVKYISDQIKESDREALYEGIQKHEEIIPDEEGSYKTFETYKFPIENGDDKVLCGFGFDISKEELYKRKIELYSQVMKHSKDGIIITNSKEAIVSVNQAFLSQTGYTQQDLIGKKPSIIKSGKHPQKFYETLWEELHTKGSWSGEIFNENKDGTVIPRLVTIYALKDKRKRLTNYIGIYQNSN